MKKERSHQHEAQQEVHGYSDGHKPEFPQNLWDAKEGIQICERKRTKCTRVGARNNQSSLMESFFLKN